MVFTRIFGANSSAKHCVIIMSPALDAQVLTPLRRPGAGGHQLGEHLAARSRVVAPVEPVEEAEPSMPIGASTLSCGPVT
jgi:hypothetical protein